MCDQKERNNTLPSWANNDPLMEWYATEICGIKAVDDDQLFEIMSLQVFQAGLSWRMILARRDEFRKAFYGSKIDLVANMGPDDVDRLLSNKAIIRNLRKIEACIRNARKIQELQRESGSFCNWFYSTLTGDELGQLQTTVSYTHLRAHET